MIDRLAQDLSSAFPDMKGFSPRDLKYMRAFAEAWPSEEFVQQAVGQLPWGHNIVLLTRLKTLEQRLAYARRAVEHGWSRSALGMHIERRLLEREGQAVTNIDLLFYHLKLRCFVVIDLKRGDFKPEYAGKMNFYCNVVDEQLRHVSDAPTIGLILCQQPNRVLAEYALRGIDKPIGVSAYDLTRALPTELQSSLPSIESIEQALAGAQAEEAP